MYLNLVWLCFLSWQLDAQTDRKSLAAGYWRIQAGQFDQVNGDILVAQADFNQDRFTDLVTIDSTLYQRISINIWNTSTSVFDRRILNLTASQMVVSVIPGDFNYDGNTDLMVTYDAGDSYSIQIVKLTRCQTLCQTQLIDPNNPLFHNLDRVEPFFLDLDGNRTPDIFYVKEGVRIVLQIQIYQPPPPPPPPTPPVPDNTTNNTNNTDPVQPQNDTVPASKTKSEKVGLQSGDLVFTSYPFSKYIKRRVSNDTEEVPPPLTFYPLSTHYASFIDYTGDCMADLVMLSDGTTSRYLEFYKNNQDGTFSQPILYQLDLTLRTFSFSDSNFDGAIDLLLLFQNSADPAFLQVHHNKYPSKQSLLCLQNTDFPFDMGALVDDRVKKIQRYTLGGRLPQDILPVLRFGDLDLDGYPDTLINLVIQEQGAYVSKTFLYMNTQCVNETCGQYNPSYTFFSNVTDMRYYKPYTINTFNVTNVRSIATYDFFQDGKQDFIINYFEVKKTKQKVHYLASILNNNPVDAFSLKLLCLNGVPSQTKATTNTFGVTYELKITTLSGEFRHGVANQQFQLAHQALQSPNVIIGLGRTNNYVQDLTVGVSQNVQNNQYRNFHSQEHGHPQSPTPNQQQSPHQNSRNKPTEKMKTVFSITLVVLLVLGLIIRHLNNKEKAEDKQNMDNFYTVLKG